jgi:four helix bundle protein
MPPIKTFRDLEVYELARKLALKIFILSKKFPPEEKYSLTDQVRRSSRSIAANIAEGWGKRIYEDVFKRHLIDALGSLEETKSWLLSGYDCEYISEKECDSLFAEYELLGGKVYTLHKNWKSK